MMLKKNVPVRLDTRVRVGGMSTFTASYGRLLLLKCFDLRMMALHHILSLDSSLTNLTDPYMITYPFGNM